MKGKTRIWIQAVSVGELSSISKLLIFLLDESDLELVLSGTTSAGLSLGEKHYGSDVLANGPFLGLATVLKNSLEESNLIFLSLWTANSGQNISIRQKRKIPLIIVNARLSDRTFCRLRSPNFAGLSLALSLKPNGCRLFGRQALT